MYSDGDAPKKTLYCYSVEQPLYVLMRDTLPGISFQKGLPTKDDITSLSHNTHNLIILDDLITKLQKSEEILDMFTLGSHHLRISVFYLTQNIFYQGKNGRTIALNTQYLVLFKNPRDSSQINHLARQVFPRASSALAEAYQDATGGESYGYLFIDLTQECQDRLRMRSHVTPEHNTIVYIPIR